MGSLHKLYPDAKDSHDEGIFFAFKKYYQKHREEVFQALINDKQITIVTDTGQEIICTLQKFYGRDFVINPYGREYHVLLDSSDKRFGCHIEHRIRPVTGELWAQWLYPSSWMIANRKTWRSSAGLYPDQEEHEDIHTDIPFWKISLS